jgi:hypothetical protein
MEQNGSIVEHYEWSCTLLKVVVMCELGVVSCFELLRVVNCEVRKLN